MSADGVVLESLHSRGGAKVGALLRRRTPTSLTTLICLRRPDGVLSHRENRIEFDHADPFAWTHFVHHDGDALVEREHLENDPVDAIPSFAECLLVEQMLHRGQERLEFTLLVEATGEMRPAHLEFADGVVSMVKNGTVATRHRVLGEEVLASDWGGLGSRPASDVLELLDGLDEQVAVRVRHFLDD